MASAQTEAEAPRNGPEMKEVDGPNTNGVDAQREMEANSSNGPTSTPISNNGSHDMTDNKLQSSGGYYKPPVGYPVDPPAAGYENAQSGFGYPPHGYIHQQQQSDLQQQQGSYPYPQYPSSNMVRNVSSPVATKPVAYMNSMPRPGSGPVPSYPHHGGAAASAGQGYPPSRYPTPTLNQLLQPASGTPVQRYPYGDYPQQQPPPPNSHVSSWPMQQPQQPRSFAPGFKPPPSSMQQGGGYPSYGPGAPLGPGHGIQPQQRYTLTPSGPVQQPPPSQQEPVKGTSGPGSGETSAEASNSAAAAAANANANQRNSSSPSSSAPAVSSSTSTSTASVSSSTPTTGSSSTTVASSAAGRPPPVPSPASRSMSPALGPPNSNSHVSPSPGGPSDNNNSGPARMSHSPMAAQGAYQQPMPPPPHVGMSYKMGGSPYHQPQQQQQPMHHPQQQQPSGQPQQPQYLPNPMYMQHPRPPMGPGGPSPYGPTPGSYGPPQQQQQQQQQPPVPPQQQQPGMPPNCSNSNQSPMPPASPGPNRSIPPHMGPPTPYPGYPPGGPSLNQYGQQQQPNWGPASSMPGAPPGSPMPVHGGKGGPPPPGPLPTPGTRPPGPSHTPPHYMKQHLQHHLQQQQQQKVYGMASSPGPVPPAPSQGPPPPPPHSQSQQPPSQHMGPYPPSGMNNTSSMAGHPPSAASPVTNLVTTGPDGVAGLDEVSQQSTLSNTSAASGDDVSAPSTPRSRKEAGSMPMTPSAHHPPFSQQPPQQSLLSHPPTPQSTVPSPGPASLSSQHEEYNDVHSPGPGAGNWSVSTRPTPSSPKTSHVSDALARLYEFDDHPDRRKFLDQLLRFMDEKGCPITACPTISKNPLDLFRLYLLVRDRGGFLEVTKNKAWKDIAQTLGIGASSSAAYTLRKHYTKSLFPWECKFDRGGVDPQPILNQVEATTKKKPAPKISVPSPAGSSNSQDSFPSSGVPPIPSMDGYPNAHYPGYPPPHTGENIAASNPFDDQQHYGGRGGHPGYPPHPPPPPQQHPQQQQQQQQQSQQQQQQQQPQQPSSMYNTIPGRPGAYPGHPSHPSGHPNQGYHHPYQNEYSNPNSQQYPPYPAPPNRTMYSAPYPEPYNPQTASGGQAPPPGPGPGPAPNDPYGRFMPPNHAPGAATAPGPYPPRPPVPPTAQTSVPTSAPSPSPAAIAPPSSSSTASVPPSPLAQSMQPQPPPQQQPPQPQGNTSAGPSPAPSPAPNAGASTYSEQNDQYPRSGLRQLLASSTLMATSPSDRQPGYPVGSAGSNLGPTTGQPYPGLIRPGTPGPTPSGMAPRQPTPTSAGMNPPVGSVPGAPNASGPSTQGAPLQQQQQQPGPYPAYGPPGQPQNQQPRQPSFDPYVAYRSPYGPTGSNDLAPNGGVGTGLSNNLATGWRNNTPYVNQYPPQGSSPGPVQSVGAPWVPPTGTPQPRNPAWDQAQRYPGPMPATPATTINGTSHQQGPPTPVAVPPHPIAQQQQAQQPTQPPQQPPQSWPGPQTMANARPPFMGHRPPYRGPDGKPYAMPPLPGKGPISGPPGAPPYTQGIPTGPPNMPIYPVKRESYFPPDSIEAVMPVMSKRRRICRADVVPVDAWRVYLALKSGLLAESTWAIDVLNVLLYDDASVHYFSLAYMPGLAEVLLEHFRRCLSQIFTILEDMEIGYDRVEEFKRKIKQRAIKSSDSSLVRLGANGEKMEDDDDEDAWWNWHKRKAEPDYMDAADLGAVKASDMAGERIRVLDAPDLSMNARRGEKAGIVPRDKEMFIVDVKKEWDVHDGFESGMDQWQIGGGDTTQHIVTHFTAELNIVPFVRILKKVDKKTAAAAAENEEAEVESDGDKSTTVEEEQQQPVEEEPSSNSVAPFQTKNCSKPGRSLADVLKRIKKEEDEDDGKATAEVSTEVAENHVRVIKKEATETVEPIKSSETVEVTATSSKSTEPVSSSTVMSLPSGERLVVKDPHGTLKRRKMDEYEDECYTRDESSLHLVDDSQDTLARRALAISNIFRSLSFVPSNEAELAKNSTLLVIVGKILLLHHDHPLRSSHQKNYDREEEIDFASVDSLANSSGNSKGESDWWWDTLLALRENVLVLMANIAGQLDLSIYSEEIVRPLIDGLLHWAVCPSAQSQDPFSSFGPHSTSLVSPQRLSLEALCKLMVMDANMDLILATPPFTRLEKLVHFLTRSLCRTEDQVLREFAVNLLYYLSAADSGMARLIALHNNSLALLVSFVEQAEANALAVASQHGIQALRENPESMGTSLDMLRRAASTVFYIARHPDSRPLLAKLEQRLLALVMSQIMDQSVAALLSKSLYLCNSDDE